MEVVIRRFEVHLVGLDPSIGPKMRTTRPGLIISPDEMNRHISTVIIAPLTTRGRSYPTRVACRFQGKRGQVVVDQIRTVDKGRLIKKLGTLHKRAQTEVLAVLREMFAA